MPSINRKRRVLRTLLSPSVTYTLLDDDASSVNDSKAIVFRSINISGIAYLNRISICDASIIDTETVLPLMAL